MVPVPSEPHKRWNFRKANWELYGLITNKLALDLPSPNAICADEVYQDFCDSIFTAAKTSIPRGRRNNYRPCWDAECEQLYQAYHGASPGEVSSMTASVLLARLDHKRTDRWTEAIKNIDFTIGNLTDNDNRVVFSQSLPTQMPYSW